MWSIHVNIYTFKIYYLQLTPTTNLQNPDQIPKKNLNNYEDDDALIARLVHEADITEEFHLDDSFQLDQINLDELPDTQTNHNIHMDSSSDDNQLTDTNNPEDIHTHTNQ